MRIMLEAPPGHKFNLSAVGIDTVAACHFIGLSFLLSACWHALSAATIAASFNMSCPKCGSASGKFETSVPVAQAQKIMQMLALETSNGLHALRPHSVC